MSRRLSLRTWISLALTLVIVLLGVTTLVGHLRQPSFPALPGRGCIVVTIPGPDTRYLPAPSLELNACVHISETELELTYIEAPDGSGQRIFDARVEEDPRRWADAVAVRWLSADSVQVSYRSDLRFSRRDTTFRGRGHVSYLPR